MSDESLTSHVWLKHCHIVVHNLIDDFGLQRGADIATMQMRTESGIALALGASKASQRNTLSESAHIFGGGARAQNI